MEGNKIKGEKNKQKKIVEDDKNYFRWTLEMERELANILRDERNLGNKGDGGWKPTAYNSASSMLSAQYGRTITSDNVKHRVKLWKKHYAIVSDILGQSGFNWDCTKQMITVDDDSAWNDYVKSHSNAKQFRWKVISNWDDIVDLCAKDRGTGEGAETAFDADEVMVVEDLNEINSGDKGQTPKANDSSTRDSSTSSRSRKRQALGSTATSPSISKGGTKKKMEESMMKMVNAVDVYFSMKSKVLDIDEVYEIVSAIPEMEENVVYKACNWLMEDEKKFHFLKKLPMDKKKNYILQSMPREL